MLEVIYSIKYSYLGVQYCLCGAYTLFIPLALCLKTLPEGHIQCLTNEILEIMLLIGARQIYEAETDQ